MSHSLGPCEVPRVPIHLSFQNNKMFHIHILTYSAPSLESTTFPKSLGSFQCLMGVETKTWILDMIIATGVSLILGPFNRQLGNGYVYIYLHIHIYTNIYTDIHKNTNMHINILTPLCLHMYYMHRHNSEVISSY